MARFPVEQLMYTGSMTLRTYRELDVWQRGMVLVERCYQESRAFPDDERFGLTSQLRRAAIARGSLAEVETCIEVASRLRYLPPDATKEMFELTGRPTAEWPIAVSQSARTSRLAAHRRPFT